LHRTVDEACTGSGSLAKRASSQRENHFPEKITVDHGCNALLRRTHWQHPVDERPQARLLAERHEPGKLALGTHGRSDYRQLEEEDPAQVGWRHPAAGSAYDHQAPTWFECLERVGPASFADGVHHSIHSLGQPCGGRECLIRSELQGPLTLLLAPACRPNP